MSDIKNFLTFKDTCDPKVLAKEAEKVLKEFKEEVGDTLNELSAKSLGSFAVTMAALMGQMAYGAAVNYISFAASALVGNVVGGITSMVGLMVSLFNGAHIMVRYLAAKSLSESLETRISLGEALLSDVTQVIKLLQAVEDVDDIGREVILHDIERAYPEVKQAARKVGSEYSKVRGSGPLGLNTTNPINSRNLENAQDNINEAMQFLVGDNIINPSLNKYLADLNRSYQLDIGEPLTGKLLSASVPHPGAFLKYFEEASKQLKDRHGNDSEDIVRAFLVDFIKTPGLNTYFKNYASMRYLDEYMSNIGERLPISTVSLSEMAGVDEYLDPAGALKDAASDSLDSMFDYLEVNTQQREADYPNDNSTMGGESFEIQLSQTSILMLEEWINVIDFEVGGLKIFLKPSLDHLNQVKGEMKMTLDNQEAYRTNGERAFLATEKMGWMKKLGLAKSLISSSIDSEVSIGDAGGMRPEDINRKFRDSLELFADLQSHIRGRVLDEDGEPITRTSEAILEIAEKHLKSFVMGTTSIFSSNRRGDNILPQLQAIRNLLGKQLDADRSELSIAENFIRSVEQNPAFSEAIKPGWEAMMEGLKSSTVGKFLYEDLAKGDLSSLVNGLSTAGYGATKILKVMDCVVPKDDFNDAMSRALSGGDSKKVREIENIIEETKRAMNHLRNKKFLTEKLMKLV